MLLLGAERAASTTARLSVVAGSRFLLSLSGLYDPLAGASFSGESGVLHLCERAKMLTALENVLWDESDQLRAQNRGAERVVLALRRKLISMDASLPSEYDGEAWAGIWEAWFEPASLTSHSPSKELE